MDTSSYKFRINFTSILRQAKLLLELQPT